MHKKLILFIFLQLFIIAVLSIKIANNTAKNVSGEMQVNPLRAENLSFSSPSDDLKYYFEPQANTNPKEFNPTWLNREITYHINGDNLHEKKEYPTNKAGDTYRVIVLGDSFVFGMYVQTEENWTELLESRLNSTLQCKRYTNVEVLNFGVSGFDIQYSLERFRMKGQKYNPDLVVWLLKNDDFEHTNEVMRKNEQKYIEMMKASGEYEKSIKEGKPYDYLKYVLEDMSEYREQLGFEKFFSIQDGHIKELLDMQKGQVLLLTFNDTNPYYRDYLSDWQSGDKRVTYLELKSLSSDPEYTYLPDDVHPTVQGHRAMAEEIYSYMVSEDIIPCD